MRLRSAGRSNSTYTLFLVKFLCSFDSETFREDSFPFERIRKFYLKILKSQNKEKKRNSFQGKYSSYKGDSMHEFRENEGSFGRSNF